MNEKFDLFLGIMLAAAAVVFVALHFVRAGYCMLRDGKWGPQIDNRKGWVLMEAPVFVAMTVLWLCSERRTDVTCLVFLALFQLHYLNRSFVYPFLIKGRSTMPLGIVTMGAVFNVLNACIDRKSVV